MCTACLAYPVLPQVLLFLGIEIYIKQRVLDHEVIELGVIMS